jgi:hypothetical protein
MKTVGRGGTSSEPQAAALPLEEEPQIPNPQAGGSYTRDPVTHQLTRNPPEPDTAAVAPPDAPPG